MSRVCVCAGVTACAQHILHVIVRCTCKNHILNFIDLCSTANISVLLLTTQRFGHYIHGQCVHGNSDISLAMWYESFKAEEVRSRQCNPRTRKPGFESCRQKPGFTGLILGVNH